MAFLRQTNFIITHPYKYSYCKVNYIQTKFDQHDVKISMMLNCSEIFDILSSAVMLHKPEVWCNCTLAQNVYACSKMAHSHMHIMPVLAHGILAVAALLVLGSTTCSMKLYFYCIYFILSTIRLKTPNGKLVLLLL